MSEFENAGAVRVLVTGIAGGGVGEQIICALRKSDLQIEIHGADISGISKGAVLVDSFFVLPKANESGYVEAVLSYCEGNGIEFIFPGSEPELYKLVQLKTQFSERGINISCNSEDVVNLCSDKMLLNHLLRQNGFRVPDSLKCTSSNVEGLQVKLPVIMKPVKGASGSADVLIAQDNEALVYAANNLLQKYEEILVQEYVGDSDSEFTVGLVSDRRGRVVSCVVLNRLIESGLGCKHVVRNHSDDDKLGRNLVVSTGISQGYIGRFPLIAKQCIKIAEVLKSTGPLNIQCRLVEGEVVVFEINPRHSGTTGLRELAGVNEPELMLRVNGVGAPVQGSIIECKQEGWALRGLDAAFLPQ